MKEQTKEDLAKLQEILGLLPKIGFDEIEVLEFNAAFARLLADGQVATGICVEAQKILAPLTSGYDAKALELLPDVRTAVEFQKKLTAFLEGASEGGSQEESQSSFADILIPTGINSEFPELQSAGRGNSSPDGVVTSIGTVGGGHRIFCLHPIPDLAEAAE